jgi:hypothetical protein
LFEGKYGDLAGNGPISRMNGSIFRDKNSCKRLFDVAEALTWFLLETKYSAREAQATHFLIC